MMLFASCIPFPFSAPCDDMLAMLIYATCWLSMQLYTLAHMSMHESCVLVCRPCFNTMELWAVDPNLHLSLVDTTFCLPFTCLSSFLFALLLDCLLVCLLAFLFLCFPCLSCLSALCLFHMLFASFPSSACLLVSCLCLCMYRQGARTHRARARSPRCKQKGRGCKHVDISQVVVFSSLGV